MKVEELIASLAAENKQLGQTLNNAEIIINSIYKEYPEIKKLVEEWMEVSKNNPNTQIPLSAIKNKDEFTKPKPQTA